MGRSDLALHYRPRRAIGVRLNLHSPGGEADGQESWYSKKRLPLIAGGAWNQRNRELFLEWSACVLPTGNAGREVLDVGVTEFLGDLGGCGICAAGGIGAVG